MSETTPFNALVRGNGFPYCPVSVDPVDEGYDYWTTLGGYNKIASDAATAVTAAQIELSKQNAMKLFWNLEKVVGEATYSFFGLDLIELELTTAPKDRVCGTGAGGFVEESVDSGSFGFITGQIRAGITIRRMYDGATFLGYGLREYDGETHAPLDYGVVPFSANVDASIFSSPFEVGLFSMINEGLNGTQDFAYTTVSGIPFVGYAAPTGTLDASVPSATNGDATASITSLEFFTYP